MTSATFLIFCSICFIYVHSYVIPKQFIWNQAKIFEETEASIHKHKEERDNNIYGFLNKIENLKYEMDDNFEKLEIERFDILNSMKENQDELNGLDSGISYIDTLRVPKDQLFEFNQMPSVMKSKFMKNTRKNELDEKVEYFKKLVKKYSQLVDVYDKEFVEITKVLDIEEQYGDIINEYKKYSSNIEEAFSKARSRLENMTDAVKDFDKVVDDEDSNTLLDFDNVVDDEDSNTLLDFNKVVDDDNSNTLLDFDKVVDDEDSNTLLDFDKVVDDEDSNTLLGFNKAVKIQDLNGELSPDYINSYDKVNVDQTESLDSEATDELPKHEWIKLSKYTNELPENAVLGGKDIDGTPLYVIRVQFYDQYSYGKFAFSENRKNAYYTRTFNEYEVDNFEILTANKYCWRDFVSSEERNQELPICRVAFNGSLTPGNLHSNNICRVGFKWSSFDYKDDFEVLSFDNCET